MKYSAQRKKKSESERKRYEQRAKTKIAKKAQRKESP